MCDQCKTLYHSNEKHDESVCPIANSLFCSCCKKLGHTTLECPNTINWQTRIPEFVEQLIPFELRLHHGITKDQMTPIQNPNPNLILCHHILKEQVKMGKTKGLQKSCSICYPVMEIPEDKALSNKSSSLWTGNIRATLASNNLPSSSVKENKKLLEAFAKINGKKVIYLKNDRYATSEKSSEKEGKQKRSFKVKIIQQSV